MAERLERIDRSEKTPVRAVTARSVIASVAVIAVSVLWNEWMPYYTSGSNISRSHFPMAFFFPFLTACTLNLMLNHLRPGWAFSRSELMVVLGSGFVGIALAYDGLTGHFFGVLAAPYYFASVENGWGLLHDSIPLWLAPSNATGEMTRFFEGGGGAPPWRVWAVPVFWWMCFFGAMGFAVFCLVVILRKQWVDHERLAYPLVEVAQSLAETERGGGLEKAFRSPLFWIAFSLVMLLKLWNIGSYFTPAFPHIDIEETLWQPIEDFPWMVNRVGFYAIGFGYFARLEVLFSVWFFILSTAFQVYAFNIFGYQIGAATRHWTSDALGWQSIGALAFLAAWGLWMARAHLKAVVRKALYPNCEVDDRGELLSYRVAVFGLLGSFAFVAACGGHALVGGVRLFDFDSAAVFGACARHCRTGVGLCVLPHPTARCCGAGVWVWDDRVFGRGGVRVYACVQPVARHRQGLSDAALYASGKSRG